MVRSRDFAAERRLGVPYGWFADVCRSTHVRRNISGSRFGTGARVRTAPLDGSRSGRRARVSPQAGRRSRKSRKGTESLIADSSGEAPGFGVACICSGLRAVPVESSGSHGGGEQ